MRAAPQAHPSEVPASTARQALVRLLIALAATVALLALWTPKVVHAQTSATAASQVADSSTTIHVVKAGESLWLIAERYYGDGHQWQEVARRNSLSTSQDKVLVVGMKLRVPAHPVLATQPPSKGASLSAQTADKADAAPAAALPRAARASATSTSKAAASANRTSSKSPNRVASRARVTATDSAAKKPRPDTTEAATVFSRASAVTCSLP